MKVIDFLKGKFKYDNNGQFIWLIQPNGNYHKIADLRGWGAIQHLFEDKKGKIDMDEAGKFQDEVGEWITSSLNKSIEVSQSTPMGNEVSELDQRDDYYNRDRLFEHK